ncbi:MAG: hypothetical protein FJ149_07340 [Euryarchaeota archaeon]|nr:hypothetical protein [Euryarchaeota archaeon]
MRGSCVDRAKAACAVVALLACGIAPSMAGGAACPNGNDGMGGAPPQDASGAPYPVILMMPYAGGDATAYDFVAPRLVSWGLVVVCVGQNQADPSSGNANDLNDLLDQLERGNATSGHALFGMIDRGAYGISGHSRGGAYSIYHGWPVSRIRAVQAMAPALSQGDVDTVARLPAKPFEVQVGRLDGSFWAVSMYA